METAVLDYLYLCWCWFSGILKKFQLVFYGTSTNPVRLQKPPVNVPGGADVEATATIGRDIHGSPPTPFGTVSSEDILHSSGSQPVTVVASPESATPSSAATQSLTGKQTRCPKLSLSKCVIIITFIID